MKLTISFALLTLAIVGVVGQEAVGKGAVQKDVTYTLNCGADDGVIDWNLGKNSIRYRGSEKQVGWKIKAGTAIVAEGDREGFVAVRNKRTVLAIYRDVKAKRHSNLEVVDLKGKSLCLPPTDSQWMLRKY